MAKACHHRLLPFLQDYVRVLVLNLDPQFSSVCNNASWAIGELTIKAGPELMQPLLPTIMSRLVPIMNDAMVHRSLLENTAITIGRLAKTCPQVKISVGSGCYDVHQGFWITWFVFWLIMIYRRWHLALPHSCTHGA